MHARSGGSLEVMGLMQGYILPETFVVTDAFRLPVEGTETRVNAQEEAYKYMVEYLTSCRQLRPDEWRTRWDGIIAIQDMDAGFLESTCRLRT